MSNTSETNANNYYMYLDRRYYNNYQMYVRYTKYLTKIRFIYHITKLSLNKLGIKDQFDTSKIK